MACPYQHLNAGRVETLGLGTVVDSASTIDVLRRTIQNMLDDGLLLQRAQKFADSLQDHPGIEDALRAIDKTIDDSRSG